MKHARALAVPPAVPFAAGAASAVYLDPGSPSRLVASMAAMALALGAALVYYRSREAPAPSPRRRAALLAAAAALGLCFGASAHRRAESAAGRFCPGFSPSSRYRAAAYEGVLSADPRRTSGGLVAYELELTAARGPDGAATTAAGRLAIYARPAAAPRGAAVTDAAEPLRGQAVAVSLGRPLLPPREGLGAWPDALASRSAFVDSADIAIIGPAPRLEAVRARARRALLAALSAAGGESGPLLEALVVGVRDDLDGELADDFRKAGCAHILALSGQHVGILAAFASLILGFALGPFRAKAVACALAALYLYVVGASPSVARAVTMFWLASAAGAADRPQPRIAILALAFVVAAALRPESAHALSFKLSYLAVAGIAALSPGFELSLRRWLPPPVSGAVATGFAALAATAPLSAMAFGTLNPFSPVTSAAAGLLVTVLMWAALAGAALVAALPAAAPLVSLACYAPYRALSLLMGLAAGLPSLSAAGSGAPGSGAPGGGASERLFLALGVALGAAIVYAWPYVAYRSERRSAARQLRLPQGPLRPARGPRPGHAQEVRPEFPRLRPGAPPHRRPLRGSAGRPRVGDRPGHRLHDP